MLSALPSPLAVSDVGVFSASAEEFPSASASSSSSISMTVASDS